MFFISCLDSHSDGPVHYRGSISEQVIQCNISPNPFRWRNKTIYLSDGIRVSTFETNFIEWTIPLKRFQVSDFDDYVLSTTFIIMLMQLTQAIERSYVVDHEAADAVIGQRVKHTAECTGSCCCTNQIFQNQIPANKKSHEFSYGHIAVSIGRACGFRHTHTKFSIAHPCGEITMITVTPALLEVINISMQVFNWLLRWNHRFFFLECQINS